MSSYLQDYLAIEGKSSETLVQLVEGLASSIDEMEDKIQKAIEYPQNLFLLPLVCETNSREYFRAWQEISSYSRQYLFLSQDEEMQSLGFNYDYNLSLYQEQVLNIFGVFKKRLTADLIVSMQMKVKKILDAKKNIKDKNDEIKSILD